MLSGTNVLNLVTRDTAVSSKRVSYLRSYPNMAEAIREIVVYSNIAYTTEVGVLKLVFVGQVHCIVKREAIFSGVSSYMFDMQMSVIEV